MNLCRCNAKNFKLSKSQKKIIKRVNRYLSDSLEDKSCEDTEMHSEGIYTQMNHGKRVTKLSTEEILLAKKGFFFDAINKLQTDTAIEDEENTSTKCNRQIGYTYIYIYI